MSFSSAQIKKLQQDLRTDCVRSREIHGRQMHYIEGWHAIAEANRIFGFDAWSRETVESRCVLSRESKGTFHTVYIAKVRITVRTSEASIIREGFGTGDAQASSAGEAHDKAIKTAETDATKRAFGTFGKPFGLSLYLGSRLRAAETTPPIERRRTEQRLGPSGRYYVPARPRTMIDPALKLANGTSNDGAHGTHANGANGIDADSAGWSPDRANGKSADGAGGSNGSTANPIPPGMANRVGAEPAEDCATSATEVLSAETTSPAQRTPNQAEPVTDCSQEPFVDPMLIARGTRRRDIHHLRYVAGQPCLVCNRTPSDPHHLKFAQPQAMSKKVSDEFTVPLCRIHHRQLHHGGNEINWWIDMDIDPLPIAKDLWDRSHGTPNKE